MIAMEVVEAMSYLHALSCRVDKLHLYCSQKYPTQCTIIIRVQVRSYQYPSNYSYLPIEFIIQFLRPNTFHPR